MQRSCSLLKAPSWWSCHGPLPRPLGAQGFGPGLLYALSEECPSRADPSGAAWGSMGRHEVLRSARAKVTMPAPLGTEAKASAIFEATLNPNPNPSPKQAKANAIFEATL